jgi:hypothetical protein
MTDALAQARKALEAFSDPMNWTMHSRFDPNSSIFDGTRLAESALAAIDAALEGGAVPKVRPLKWKPRKHGYPDDIFVNTIVGEYAIGNVHGRVLAILRTIKGSDSFDETLWEGFDFSRAKQAAQADYERRIRSAIVLGDDDDAQ